nr:MAG TPA: hypothetical protein [Caudoviricetes sp.]
MSDNSIGTPSGLRPAVVHSLAYWLARVCRRSPPLIAHLFYHNYNNNLLTLCL